MLRTSVVGIVWLLSAVPAVWAATPSATVGTVDISGSGFSRGGQVAVFGIANPPQPYSRRLATFEQIVTADADGAFRWEPPEAPPQASVWFAVDLRSGDYAVGARGGTAPPAAALPAVTLLAGRDAGGDALTMAHYFTNVFLVRPNDGIWRAMAVRNGSDDLNRSSATRDAHFAVRGLHAADKSSRAVGAVTPADVVIAVDPVSLEFWIGRPSVAKEAR